MPHLSARRVLLFALLLLILIPGPAFADTAPPPPPEGSNPQPGSEQTQVRMMAETVTMVIANRGRAGTAERGQAKVTAHFEMRNLGGQEEKMEARFPLSAMMQIQPNQFECWDSGYPPINDLAVRVDGKPAAVRTERQTGKNGLAQELKNQPCWGHFWVTFPPDQNVTIDVTYTVLSGDTKYSPFQRALSFYYILETGRAWKDTIGSADIIIHAPYELTDQNLIDALPAGYAFANGNEARWRFENLEPEYKDNIYVSIVEPGLWQSILTARQQTASQPENAAAWTALAYADHQALLMGVPFDIQSANEEYPIGGFLRRDPGGVTLANECKLAYQKAIALQPKNSDLRLHYADLLWQDAYTHYDDPATTQRGIAWSLQEIQAVLKLDPNNKLAQAKLNAIAQTPWMNGVMIDLNQPTPVYYILTPLPTATATLAPTATALPPTETVAATSTAASTATSAAVPTEPSPALPMAVGIAPTQLEPAPAQVEAESTRLAIPVVSGAIALVVAALVAIMVAARRRR